MPIYSLIEYGDNCSNTSRVFLQYHRNEPALNKNGFVIDFPDDNDSALFEFN